VDFEGFAGVHGLDPTYTSLFDGILYPNVQAFEDLADSITSIPLTVDPQISRSKTWQKWTPAVTLSFLPGEASLEPYGLGSLLAYLTYSEGFKAGGFEPRRDQADPTTGVRDLDLLPFEPEEVDNYEIGIKLDSIDKKLRFNAAIYHMDYTNIQVRNAETGTKISNIDLYLTNAGKATVQGAELELTWLPIDGLVVAANASYTDADYKEFIVQGSSSSFGSSEELHRDKEDFGNVPDTTFGLDVSYTLDTGVGLIVPRINGYYRSEMFIGNDSSAINFDDSTLAAATLYNFRLAWYSNEQLDATLYVNNLTNKEYYTGGTSIPTSMGSAVWLRGETRVYGVEFQYRM